MARSEDFAAASGAARGEAPAVGPRTPLERRRAASMASSVASAPAAPAPPTVAEVWASRPSEPNHPEDITAKRFREEAETRAARPAPVAPTPRPTREEVRSSMVRNEGGGDTEGKVSSSEQDRLSAARAAARPTFPVAPMPEGDRTNRDILNGPRGVFAGGAGYHHKVLKAKVDELMATHANHPDVGNAITEAYNLVNDAEYSHLKASKLITAGNRETPVKGTRGGPNRRGNDEALGHVADVTGNLLKAHDILVHDPVIKHVLGNDTSGVSNAHPGISREDLALNDAYARKNRSGQGRQSARRSAAPPKFVSAGGGSVINVQKEGGAAVVGMVADGTIGHQEAKRGWLEKAYTPTERPLRSSEYDPAESLPHVDASTGLTASDEDVAAARKTKDPKAPNTTPEPGINIDKASLATGFAPVTDTGRTASVAGREGRVLKGTKPTSSGVLPTTRRARPGATVAVGPEPAPRPPKEPGDAPGRPKVKPSRLVTTNPVTKDTHTHRLNVVDPKEPAVNLGRDKAAAAKEAVKTPKARKPTRKETALADPAIAKLAASLTGTQSTRKKKGK